MAENENPELKNNQSNSKSTTPNKSTRKTSSTSKKTTKTTSTQSMSSQTSNMPKDDVITKQGETSKENTQAINQALQEEKSQISASKKKKGIIAGVCAAIALIGAGGIIGGIVISNKNKPYSITINTQFPNSVSGEGSKYKLGDKVALKAEDVVGYKFLGWTLNGSDDFLSTEKEFTFTLTKDLAGKWNAVYEIIDYTISKSEGTDLITIKKLVEGSLQEIDTANYEDIITLEVAYQPGQQETVFYKIAGQNDEIVIVKNAEGKYQFTMPANNVTVGVRYASVDYEITKIEENGTFKIMKDSAEVSTAKYDDTLTITDITPNKGYEIDKAYFIINGNVTDITALTFKISDADSVHDATKIQVVVTFKKIDYTITKTEENGTFKVVRNSQETTTANLGDTLIITDITPAKGYEVDKIYFVINGQSTDLTSPDYTFEVTETGDILIVVTFKKIDYTITKTEENGTFKVVRNSQETTTANLGDTLTITDITPAKGYAVDKAYFVINGQSTDLTSPDYTFEVTETGEIQVVVIFKKVQYTIQKTGDVNSYTVNKYIDNNLTIIENAVIDDIIYINMPLIDNYYSKIDVFDKDNNPVEVTKESDTLYFFTMPASNITILAQYKAFSFGINTVSYGGTVDVSNSTAKEKDKIILTLTKEDDSLDAYSLTVTGDESGKTIETTQNTDGTISFIMPGENVTINLEYYKKIQVDGNVASAASCRNNQLKPENKFSISFKVPTGYTFLGWATNNANGTIISESSSYSGYYDKGIRTYKYYGLAYETASAVDYTYGGLKYTLYPGTGRCMVNGLEDGNTNTSITIPNSITYTIDGGEETTYYVYKVNDNAFIGTAITSVTFPTSQQFSIIGASAFSGTQIESLTLPAGVTYLGQEAFSACTNLQNVDMSQMIYPFNFEIWSGYNPIKNNTFLNCTRLEIIKFPYLMNTLGMGTFKGCTNLKGNKIITDENTQIGVLDLRPYKFLTAIGPERANTNTFENCNSINYIYLPSQSCTVADSSFNNTTGIILIDINGTTLSSKSFYGATIENVYIGENTTITSSGAFSSATVTNIYVDSSQVYSSITSNDFLFKSNSSSKGSIENLYIRKDIVDNDSSVSEDGAISFTNTYLNDETVFTKTEEIVNGQAYYKYVKISEWFKG